MPSDMVFKLTNAAHRTAQKVTGGKVGWRAANMPVVELTTTGRKSGRARTVLLTSPWQQDGTLIVVASRGGDDQHPAWFVNLRANPDVTVSLGGEPAVPMTARVATADERAELWPQITAQYRNYADYQARTEREIPLVFLEPTAA